MAENTLFGPCKIDCALRCEVPAGVTFHPVPVPRHGWRDVAVCPNDNCGLAFLMVRQERQQQAERTEGA